MSECDGAFQYLGLWVKHSLDSGMAFLGMLFVTSQSHGSGTKYGEVRLGIPHALYLAPRAYKLCHFL